MNIQQSYREATVGGASPVELVVRLYEQMIKDLREVADAIEQKDITLRTGRIKHAILVVGHLQSSLDFAKGGKVAKDLDNFYNAVRQSLVWVQFILRNPGSPSSSRTCWQCEKHGSWLTGRKGHRSRPRPA